jgi:hypothetical protein
MDREASVLSTLADTRFREWTKDLDACESIISVFQHIRDIPYSLTAPGQHGMKAAERILVSVRGSCGPKHYLLAEMYRRLGFDVVFATFPFIWNDPDLRYPQNSVNGQPAFPWPTTLPAASGSTTGGYSLMLPGTGPWRRGASRSTRTGMGGRIPGVR